MAGPAEHTPLHWDIFCRVVDNFGDIGVCWRLAADLAERGHAVRLWADDTSALRWLAPGGVAGVEVVRWVAPVPAHPPGDVVIEAFGCDPPPSFVAAMAAQPRPPVWLNVEYLSAEPYVERSHGLRSPQSSGPGRGLSKWFFYPGFTRAAGGLLREPGLTAARAAFNAPAWLASQSIAPAPGERLVSVFCYPHAPLAELVQRLADRPTLLLATPGAAQEGLASLALPATVRAHALPWLSQLDFDHLLWACELNLVRGEDSFVRAQWAGAPFLWHIYPQHDGVHAAKLDAFLGRYLAQASPSLAVGVRAWMRAWNGLSEHLPRGLPGGAEWQQHGRAWGANLAEQGDLTGQLLAFVHERR